MSKTLYPWSRLWVWFWYWLWFLHRIEEIPRFCSCQNFQLISRAGSRTQPFLNECLEFGLVMFLCLIEEHRQCPDPRAKSTMVSCFLGRGEQCRKLLPLPASRLSILEEEVETVFFSPSFSSKCKISTSRLHQQVVRYSVGFTHEIFLTFIHTWSVSI